MQGTIVMLLALGGIGCQNPTEGPPPTPPGAQAGATPSPSPSNGAQAGATPSSASNGAPTGVATPPSDAGQADVAPPPSIPGTPPLAEGRPIPGPTGNDATNFVPPPPYPVYSGGPFSALDVQDDSFGTCVRYTLWSFIIGRDPNVPSACEIESAYRAGLYNN